MKVGIITKSNSKGQIVIPKELRTLLGINTDMALNLIVRGNGLFITPIEEILTNTERETSYLTLLKKTQGSWGKDKNDSLGKKKIRFEIAASKKRKKAW